MSRLIIALALLLGVITALAVPAVARPVAGPAIDQAGWTARKQQVTVRTPGAIESASVRSGAATIGSSERIDTRTILLPASQEVTLEFRLR